MNKIDQLEQRLVLAEARIVALEARPVFDYCGVWQPATRYPRGAVVTHAGSAWCALDEVIGQRPGEAATGWRLMVKRGRDGKDARDGAMRE